MSVGALARRRLYYRFFGADGVLGSQLLSGASVLDVGCSDGRGSEALMGAYGCDIHRPSLERAAASRRRSRVVQADVRQLPYRSRSFDVVTALDVVEHLEKPDALTLIGEMERVSRDLVVIMTPVGFLPQPASEDEPWQEHKCGFNPEELEVAGYHVLGVGGVAGLRGPYGAFRWGPVGQGLALLTQSYLRSRPIRAFHFIGVKRLAS